MNVPNARVVAGKKFFWDGREYAARDDAATAKAAYERDGFESCMAEDGEAFLVYTRRVAGQAGSVQDN